jgi:hypothetical protein
MTQTATRTMSKTKMVLGEELASSPITRKGTMRTSSSMKKSSQNHLCLRGHVKNTHFAD